MLKFEKLTDQAISPFRGSKFAAGLDVSSPRDHIIPSKDIKLIFFDLRLFIPDGCYVRTAGRSGLLLKKSIQVISGVLDRDYTGNLGVFIYNGGHSDYEVKRGDRIAQIIIEKCLYTDACEITREEGERVMATMDLIYNKNNIGNDIDANQDFSSGKITTLSPVGTMPPPPTLRGDNGFGSTGK